MNNNTMIMVSTTNTPTSSDLQLCPVSPDGYDSFRPTLDTFDVSAGNVQAITTIRPHHPNPRRKRTKMIRFHNIKPTVDVNVASCSHSGVITKKKSDPSAPKITRPCTECGKRFWSWKALFGHMRCHPERPWRGINPPSNLHHPPLEDLTRVTTEEDQYVAACLLMLANTPTENIPHHHPYQPGLGFNETLAIQITDPETRFECSSCKKVFGSHQALGGHRASHKNVKGCFAITRNEEIEDGEFVSNYDRNVNVVEASGQHKCSICFKIFSSGQALGGHKRRHWDKDDSVVPTASTSVLSQPFRFDLNLPPPPPPPPQDDSTCSSSDLDLRLGV